MGYTGCSAAWLARLTGGQEVGGSNPLSPTSRVCPTKAKCTFCSGSGPFLIGIYLESRIMRISEAGISLPESMPGQGVSFLARSQEVLEVRFSGQKGHDLH